MSIEALLEAAKYVELTGEPRPSNVTPEITAASHGREKEVVEKQEREEDDQHVTEMFGIESSSAQEGLPTTIPQTFVDIEQQQQETGPRPEPGLGSTSHDVEQSVADSRAEERITDSGGGLSQQETLVSQLQMAHQQQQPSVAVEQINPVGLLTQQNVMRHPGYDVSWSYSAPTSLKSNASSSPNGNLLEPATSEALGSRVDDTNSDDGEDGKKSGVREVHNKLEKNRRAHLKECFDALKSQIPTLQDRKVKISNSNILSGACRYIGALKRKEKELEHELDRLVKEKIQKQKLLQRLKVEKGKDLHRGMAWDQQGSVISGDLVQDRNLVEQQEQEEEAERSHEQDEEDRYSTSTASEAEEEERKSQGFCTGVPSVVTTGALMTITVTTASTAVSGCQTTQSYGSDSMPSGSYRHPLKSHLLREHRAQLAREAAAATTSPTVASIMSEATRTTSHLQMTRALNIVKPMNSLVTVVPNMPISPSARPTVSQLLGKHTVPIRQPVRKQAPSNPLQTVLQPTSIPIQRYQAPGMGFTRPSGEFAVRPSGTTQPVVTIGVTQALQSRPDLTSLGIKLSRGQLLPVVSQGLKLPNGQVVTNTPSLGPALSIVSSSLPSSFLQATIPGGNTPLTQPMVSPIALSTPVKQVFLTHPNLAGYTSLNPSLLSPFVPPTCQTVGSSLVTNLNQTRPPQVTLIPNNNPRSHPFMPIHNSPVPRVANVSVRNSYMNATTSPGNLPLNSAVLGAHQITTLSSSSTTMFPPGNHHHKQSNVTSKPKTHKSDRVISPRSKTLLTTSQIAQTLLANGGMSKVKTVTAGSNKTQCTVTQSVVTMS